VTDRAGELAANLARLRARISAAAAAAGRAPAEVTLIAVTKTYPASDLVVLAGLGVRDIGENRDQEAAPKLAEVARQGVRVRAHFVGRLQRNKCRSVVRYAELVHSVDSARLAAALGAAAGRHRDRPLEVLVQVGIDADPTHGGVLPDQLGEVADAVAAQPALRLRGVMAIAPVSWPPVVAFERLAGLAERLRADHPAATIISAGMSGDLEAAVGCGATHLRIGTDLLGTRAPLG
jgi:hypothetical protein